ncbi:MAG: hypothetical protein ACLFNL_10815, partial [Bacteroidales bacterium]
VLIGLQKYTINVSIKTIAFIQPCWDINHNCLYLYYNITDVPLYLPDLRKIYTNGLYLVV